MDGRTPPPVAGFDEPLPLCFLPQPACHGESIPVNARLNCEPTQGPVPAHPARFSDVALQSVGAILAVDALAQGRTRPLVLDPFAGVGHVHELSQTTVGVEIEPDWAQAHRRTLVGDATVLPFADATFDVVVTSPCYGNRLSDHHDAKDASRRHTYRHSLGHPLAANNAGSLPWGERYRELHAQAWRETQRVLRSGGLCLIVVSDHIRKGERQRVVDWHLSVLIDIGFLVEQVVSVATIRLRHGANAARRVDSEKILVVRR